MKKNEKNDPFQREGVSLFYKQMMSSVFSSDLYAESIILEALLKGKSHLQQ